MCVVEVITTNWNPGMMGRALQIGETKRTSLWSPMPPHETVKLLIYAVSIRGATPAGRGRGSFVFSDFKKFYCWTRRNAPRGILGGGEGIQFGSWWWLEAANDGRGVLAPNDFSNVVRRRQSRPLAFSALSSAGDLSTDNPIDRR